MNPDATTIDIKPNKRAFMALRLAVSLLGSMAAIVAVIILSIVIEWWISLALILVLAGTVYDIADALVAYKKQGYRVGQDRIYFDEGHLFSDRKTELRLENITTVRVIKPFIEYNLFATGQIRIEAAGSKAAAVTFRSIDQPYQVFEDIKQILGQNTFSLTYDSLLSEKKPSPLAVMLQIIGGALVLLFFVLTNIGVATGLSAWLFDLPLYIPISLGGLALALAFAYILLVYRDQARRTYSVYNDVIHYSKGYLTKQEAFIPAANLANTELTQNWIGKLLSLQDVVVSCQGQGGKINFANLRHGKDMQAAINQLINNRKRLFKASRPSQTAQVTQPESSSGQLADIPKRILASPTPEVDDADAQDYYMDYKRALMAALPAVLFPPVFAILALQFYIITKRTVYRLTDGGVASYYSFLSTKNVEISRDKITGLIIRRNPIDRWMNTCSVEFWSIGSGTVLRMNYIAYSPDLVQTMKAKAAIPDDQELETLHPQFTIKLWLLANLPLAVVISLATIVTIVLAVVVSTWFYVATTAIALTIAVVAIVLDRRYKRTELRLGRYTTYMQVGVLFRKHYWALNQNIKRVTLTKYPLADTGTVRFDVAGEHPVSDGNANNKSPGLAPNRFAVPYIGDLAAELDDQTAKFDAILSSNPPVDEYQRLVTSYPQTDQKTVSRPDLKNKLWLLIPLHVIIVPLILLLPVSIWLRWLWLRHVSYICTDDRVIKRWGVIYRQQTSIIFNKLDYTENGQGVINKLSKNGNVYLYTAGSSDVELTLNDMSDYRQFHQLVTRQKTN